MAPGARFRPVGTIFDGHNEPFVESNKPTNRPFPTTGDHNSKGAVLNEITVNQISNAAKPGVDLLALNLERPHLHGPAKENKWYNIKITSPRRKGRPSIESLAGASDPRRSCDESVGSTISITSLGRELVEGQQLPSNQKQLAKHNAGEFEWVLEVPAPSSDHKDQAPCQTHQQDRKRLASEEVFYFGCNLLSQQTHATGVPREGQSTSTYTLIATCISGDEKTTLTGNTKVLEKEEMPTVTEQVITIPPTSAKSRIEDNIEAFDRTEDELEALRALAERPTTPREETGGSLIDGRATDGRMTDGSVTDRRATDGRATDGRVTDGSPTMRRSTITRPASLKPPKPLAKSSKTATRPTFELPGDVFSRKARAEREAKLQAQEEEERKRREFKARPMRNSIAPSTLPRETIASRARQSRTSEASGLPTRGRLSLAGSSSATNIERTTSTSTGGINDGGLSRRNTISVEEVKQQKLRAKAVVVRDNSFHDDREHQRREREAAAKRARQEAAERTRQSAREFAEKQRLRLQKKQGTRFTTAEK